MSKSIKREKVVFLFIVIMLAALLFETWTLSVKGSVETEDQTVPGDGGTDVEAGVTIDYMGKLAFWVHDRGTGNPIENASIELWITSLDRYVLFGMTDKNGYYEVDVAYAESGKDYREQYSTDGTKFTGVLLRFSSNKDIKWRVYKDGWLDYPTEGEIEELNTRPKTDSLTTETTWVHEVFVKLRKSTAVLDEVDQNLNDNSKGIGRDAITSPLDKMSGKAIAGSETTPPKSTTLASKTLPKTGIETKLFYWGIGLLMMLLASILLIILLRRNKSDEAEKRA